MAANESEVFESWEEMEDSGALDKKLKKMKPKTPPEESEIKRVYLSLMKFYAVVLTQQSSSIYLRNFSPTISTISTVIIQEDGLRAQYVPPEPTVKILKRPARSMNRNGDGFQFNGDSKPRQPIKTLQQREQEYAEARLRILGEARSPAEQPNDDRVNRIQMKMEVLRTTGCESENIVRHPKGPDGTKGFHVRR
ncbi:hypothetical protein J437_LFUL013563 [Ladona fulva]|uniref:SUZ RNA-binding domain-containing n=1 Tax=Ladona fulva TaxID=123851 RepID=A0A8K0P5Q6_LADFU|nr:hypothetical protein J437_LFUL013563 [Ladona fulva]